ncbi:hypothetical protein EBU24_05750 [bacterium]|nr:hypothetical protein [bacterium]
MIPITLIECIEYGEDNLRDIVSIQYSRGFDNEAKAINYQYNSVKLERVNDISGKIVITKRYANERYDTK